MPRAYGITNAAPYATAPAVGVSGDTYWNTTSKILYVSDGTVWVAAGPGAGGPPTGAAGGDLSGTYPAPTVTPAAKSKWTDSGTALTPVTTTNRVTIPGPTGAVDRAQLVLGTDTAKGRMKKIAGLDWYGMTFNESYNGSAWAQDDATKAGWTSAFNTDNYEITRWGAGGTPVGTPLQVKGSDGKTYCTLADKSVTGAMLAVQAATRGQPAVVVPAFSNVTANTWLKIVDIPSYTPRGGMCLIHAMFSGFITANSSGGDCWLGLYKDGAIQAQHRASVRASTTNINVPIPTLVYWSIPPAGVPTVYSLWLLQGTNTLVAINGGETIAYLTEFS